MKKIFVTIIMIAMVITMLAGCGNMSLGLGNYTYEKIHVDTYHYSGCFTIHSWHDNASGVEVLTEEVGSIFLSEGTYIMLEGDKECPFCADKTWVDDVFDSIK